MLSATAPNGDRVLENFKMFLILRSVNSDHSGVLSDYFFKILDSANKILEEPTTLSDETLPEAVSLAVRLLKEPILKDIFSEISQETGLTVQQAASALESMESTDAFCDKFADIGEAVYATA